MKKCPKCSSQYGDDAKICRTCGAILEDAAEEPPQAVEDDPSSLEDDNEQETIPIKQDSWTCSQCGQSVPGGFEVCWNCGTSHDGVPDPDFNKEPGSDDDDLPGAWQLPELEPVAKHTERPCPKCGSSKIIPNTRILDQGLQSDGKLHVMLYGNPKAMIFKDRYLDHLTADICGDCGHVELKAVHPKELYEHYLRSKSEGGA